MKESRSAHYEHGVDKPMKAKVGGRPVGTYGCDDFKSEAHDQAYGQAGMAGCKKDMGKIHSQHFHSYTDDHSAMKG